MPAKGKAEGVPRIGPMEYCIDVARGVVTVVSHANPTLEEWCAALKAVFADPQFQRGFGFLSDRRAVPEPASIAWVRGAARFVSEHPDVFRGARWAALVDTPVGYGMTRVGQAYVRYQVGMVVEAFNDRQQAIEWLCEGLGSDVGDR